MLGTSICEGVGKPRAPPYPLFHTKHQGHVPDVFCEPDNPSIGRSLCSFPDFLLPMLLYRDAMQPFVSNLNPLEVTSQNSRDTVPTVFTSSRMGNRTDLHDVGNGPNYERVQALKRSAHPGGSRCPQEHFCPEKLPGHVPRVSPGSAEIVAGRSFV